MSDGATAIGNGLGDAYDLEEIVYKNDLWHVEKNIKSNYQADNLT